MNAIIHLSNKILSHKRKPIYVLNLMLSGWLVFTLFVNIFVPTTFCCKTKMKNFVNLK